MSAWSFVRHHRIDIDAAREARASIRRRQIQKAALFGSVLYLATVYDPFYMLTPLPDESARHAAPSAVVRIPQENVAERFVAFIESRNGSTGEALASVGGRNTFWFPDTGAEDSRAWYVRSVEATANNHCISGTILYSRNLDALLQAAQGQRTSLPQGVHARDYQACFIG
ncbi:MAG: hypothetical protein AB7G06_03410 [Bdellovibrionales bacterium]